jgi:predicted transcriptional regulator with HTH domain
MAEGSTNPLVLHKRPEMTSMSEILKRFASKPTGITGIIVGFIVNKYHGKN